MSYEQIVEYLGDDAQSLLEHKCTTISKDRLHIPHGNFVNDVFGPSDRNIQTLRSLHSLYNNGRLAGTGYLSILPVD
jgi:fructose-bisphosphate aldolase, class I